MYHNKDLHIMIKKKRNVKLPCFELIWLLNGIEMPWYSVYSFYLLIFLFFCLEAMFGKDTYMRATFATVLLLFFFFFEKPNSKSYLITYIC